MPHERRLFILTWCVILMTLSVTACGRGSSVDPGPTIDLRARETEVAAKLGATLTAKAPPTATGTATPPPPPTPVGSPSPTPEPLPDVEQIAYVRTMADESTNITLAGLGQETEQVLTHFVEPQNMCGVAWAPSGDRLVIVSAHGFMHSRYNERNVFLLRPDGTGLQMVTGQHVDPSTAPGPYVTLRGKVQGAHGPCLVSAQGAVAAVPTDADAGFELTGVPVSSQWARAVCTDGVHVMQGSTDLALAEAENPPMIIPVESGGQGWQQATLSRDGRTLAGIRYEWKLDEEGNPTTSLYGGLFDLETGALRMLEAPEGTTLSGLAWSPVADEVVGTLTTEEGIALRRWDAAGNDLGQLFRMTNQTDTIYTAADPIWSMDGIKIAFTRRDWAWWEETRYRSEVMVISASGEDVRTVVSTEWGSAAARPTWGSDGITLYYQLSPAGTEASPCIQVQPEIWSLRLEEGATPVPWRSDQTSGLPAVRPRPAPLLGQH